MSVRRAALVCKDCGDGGGGAQGLSNRLRAVLTLPDTLPDTQGWLPEGKPDYSKPGCEAPPKPGEKREIDDGDRCTCAICFSPLEESEEHGAPFILGRTCNHQFHGECLHTWVEGSKRSRPNQPVLCPTCRTPIDAADLAELGERFTAPAIDWVERVRQDYTAWRDVPLSYERWPQAMREASRTQPCWAMQTFAQKKAWYENAQVFSKASYVDEAMFCVARAPLALEHVDVDVLFLIGNLSTDYKKLAEIAVEKNWVAVKYFTRNVYAPLAYSKVPYSVMKMAIQKDSRAIEFAEVGNRWAIRRKARSILLSDREYAELAMVAVRASPSALEFVDPHDNYDVLCKEALKADPMQFEKVRNASATYYVGLAKFAVSKQGSALRFVPKRHASYMSIAMEAMKKPGKKSDVHPIHFVPYRSGEWIGVARTDDEIKTLVLEAIEHDPWGKVLFYAPASFRHDQEVVMAAVTKTWKALEFVLLDLTPYPASVLNAAVANNPAADVLPQLAKMLDSSANLYENAAKKAIDRDATALSHVDIRSENYDEIALHHARRHKSLALIPSSHRLYGYICHQALETADSENILQMLSQVDVARAEPTYLFILKVAIQRGAVPDLEADHPYAWDLRELVRAMP